MIKEKIPSVPKKVFKKLKKTLPHRVTTEPHELCCYSYDSSSSEQIPGAVVMPHTAQECSKAVSFAYENNIVVVPRGAGTGTTGGSVPHKSSLVISLEKMNSIIEIDEKNSISVVEPGLINGHFQKELKKRGFFFPPDPASMAFCTLGGNVANNAGGPRCVKYGVTRDYVLGLEVVLPNGKTLTTGVKTHKGVVGYDLTRLLVGSEGTLGVITKIFLKIIPLPENTTTLMSIFPHISKAAEAVTHITASGIIPATLEFMDSEAIRAVERYKRLGLPSECEAILLIDIDGPEVIVERDSGQVADICTKLGGSVQCAQSEADRTRLWQARRAISPALYFISPAKINEDIVVPRTSIALIISELQKISERHKVKIVSFGHAGDGNIHVNIMTDRSNKEEFQRAESSVKDIFEATLKLGGTISGEHGIGLTKKPYIGMEISEEGLILMKEIKRSFDPKGIMNSGKVFPD
jgi:glycolate oxidase